MSQNSDYDEYSSGINLLPEDQQKKVLLSNQKSVKQPRFFKPQKTQLPAYATPKTPSAVSQWFKKLFKKSSPAPEKQDATPQNLPIAGAAPAAINVGMTAGARVDSAHSQGMQSGVGTTMGNIVRIRANEKQVAQQHTGAVEQHLSAKQSTAQPFTKTTVPQHTDQITTDPVHNTVAQKEMQSEAVGVKKTASTISKFKTVTTTPKNDKQSVVTTTDRQSATSSNTPTITTTVPDDPIKSTLSQRNESIVARSKQPASADESTTGSVTEKTTTTTPQRFTPPTLRTASSTTDFDANIAITPLNKKQLSPQAHQQPDEVVGDMGVNLIPSEVQLQVQTQRFWRSGIVTVFASVIVVLVVYLGLSYRIDTVSGDVIAVQTEIDRLDQSIARELASLDDVKQFVTQSQLVGELLRGQKRWTTLFQFLEQQTLPEVFYSSVVVAGGGQVNLEMTARSYKDAARQYLVFQQSKQAQAVRMGSLLLNQEQWESYLKKIQAEAELAAQANQQSQIPPPDFAQMQQHLLVTTSINFTFVQPQE